MSGPAGAGHANGSTANFAGLVSNLVKQKKKEDKETGKSNGENGAGLEDTGPSKGLPATGLKKNTKEWQEANGNSNSNSNNDHDDDDASSVSSSSSIPDNATGEDDARRQEEQANEQEGPEGNGPGKHEKSLPNGNGYHDGENHEITESPVEEEAPTQSSRSFTRSEPFPEQMQNGHDHDHEKGRGRENGVSKKMAALTIHKDSHDIDPEERADRRDSERERKMTDELGRRPDAMAGVKDEEGPSSRNEIVLDPRISHMHYHQRREPTVEGLKLGPILKVTADGEGEFPPGETPLPSRQPSRPHSHARSSNDLESYERGMSDTLEEGTWRNAMSGPQSRTNSEDRNPNANAKGKRRSVNTRFSSFRDIHEYNSNGEEGEGSSPDSPTHEHAQKLWSMLRNRVIPSKSTSTGSTAPTPGKVSALSPTVIASIPVTTELFAGQLPVMIMKTWLDRDEDGHRAVPVLLGNLRFRVGDSVGLRPGGETGKEMFKLECEYGDGAVKWVIYRELRDFLSLHAHYKAANFGTSVAGLRSSRRVEIPDFPRMSIPYLNKLGGNQQSSASQGKNQGSTNEKERDKPHKPVGKAEYAQASRDALQQYLVELIRAVIFRPESNRLCKFFELSALTLQLAPRGGFQGKAGFLKIPDWNASRRANQPGLAPTTWAAHRKPKWFIVRDSYFVATDGPESVDYYDVFLLDADFTIERPKRYYRTGLHMLTSHGPSKHVLKHKSSNDVISNARDGDNPNDIDLDNPFNRELIIASGEGKGSKGQSMHDEGEHHASQHTFTIGNSQRRMKLVAKNARQMHQFIVSMERIAAQCIWTHRNRFDSFAPLRVNVAAQWLVDGRDYFWNLSRAINMAKDRIYIHDWWISPELYLRRPGDERYRLDNLLKRKAEDGVKVFIIIYNEVSDKTTPVDSLYTKRTLTGLHPNIMVQRSPSHFQTGTFYWSHHEKLCVIDETIAFMGGLDLCYGRWDTSQHILIDDEHTSPDGPDGPVWRGKDYANERVMEYSSLDKPFEDMFDRSKVPRMPWHDVGLQIIGQPARDLCRHFVQRWNLLIRTKNHKRQMPFLLPAADFTERELQDLKLQGTCEVQICRSVGPWSLGTLTKIEHSIQNAYVKSIELSEHFVYIENQFFITSTVVDGVRIENSIGDALVNRIIRAHREETPWKACIVIPLLPGYTYPIDAGEASSVRLILECQNRTISRGTNSIFSRLRKEGIDPDEYITFFSLRGWAKFKSGVLTTEQVYIHGKTMIVDDRLVLCGSANINERSQRGDRDSELLAVIRDTDMIDGTMAGKPFKVGRFAHTLRVRLMREHVGVDVDSIDEDQLMSREPVAPADEVETWDPDHEQDSDDDTTSGITKIKARTARDRLMQTFHSGVTSVSKGMSENAISNVRKAADKVIHPISTVVGGDTVAHHMMDNGDPEERADFDPTQEGAQTAGFASSMVPTLEEKTIYERRPSVTHANGKPLFDVLEESEGGHGTTSDGHGREHGNEEVSEKDMEEAKVPERAKKDDLISDDNPSAKKSGAPKIMSKPDETELYGTTANTFIPDELASDKDKKAKKDKNEEGKMEQGQPREKEVPEAIQARKTLRKHLNAKVQLSPWNMPTPTPKINPNRFHDPLDETFWKDMWVAVAVHNTEIFRKVFRCIPDDLVTSWAQYKAFANHAEKFNKTPEDIAAPGHDEPVKVTHDGPGTHGAGGGGSGGGQVEDGDCNGGDGGGSTKGHKSETRESDVVDGKPKNKHIRESKGVNVGGGSGSATGAERKPSSADEAWAEWERDEMEELLGEIRGHLVIYPTRFLEAEDLANNFLFNSDKILPLPIYD
uniref:Phospholipase n=1 Tax=Kwoniella dejecticola CBS 10117 TaxID=1296121 RepID=A0A1A6A3X3_9TREE|nr:phospholipase D [Kwoniella dejecticola CBS 10117]OBR84758.1 phospholipase D [Kwoniella dejecticola CBS 10117]